MRKARAGKLAQAEAAKHWRGPGSADKVEKLLASLRNHRFRGAESLIRFHDALLFLRAFPHSAKVARQADLLLEQAARETARLRKSGIDMTRFDPEEVSGIAATQIHDSFTYEVADWLWQRYPQQVSAAWDVQAQGRAL